MKVDVYMPLYLGDYAKDTGDLTTEEHGAYLLIMMAMWAAGGSIPVARMAAFSRVPARRWPAVWATIQRFFLTTGETVSQGRLLRELEAAEKRRTVATNNGTRGGRPRGELTHSDNNRPVTSGLASGSVPVNRNETSSPSPSESPSDRITDKDPSPSAREIVYSPAFEAVWEHTGRRGGKLKAFKAWKAVGRPELSAIEAVWASYLLSERPQAGFIQDLSTWLNGRGHQQKWVAAAPRPVFGRASNNVAVAEEFMRERGIR